MYPIILVHGIARFDIVAEILRRSSLPGLDIFDRFQYFNGIASHLMRHGFEQIFAPNLDFAGPSALRARQLRTAIDFHLEQTNSPKAHIIAHSMGGLDSRRMIVDLQMAGKIASLTTIGSPHNGTLLADHVINEGGGELIRDLQKFIKLDLDGFKDLRVTACAEFNQKVEAAEATNEVVYQTYSSFEAEDRIFGPLLRSYKYLFDVHGPNDGLVPVDSQQWTGLLTATDSPQKPVGQKQFPLPADHLNETGWWDWEEREGMFELADPLVQKLEYEDRVRAVYLEIAEWTSEMER